MEFLILWHQWSCKGTAGAYFWFGVQEEFAKANLKYPPSTNTACETENQNIKKSFLYINANKKAVGGLPNILEESISFCKRLLIRAWSLKTALQVGA